MRFIECNPGDICKLRTTMMRKRIPCKKEAMFCGNGEAIFPILQEESSNLHLRLQLTYFPRLKLRKRKLVSLKSVPPYITLFIVSDAELRSI